MAKTSARHARNHDFARFLRDGQTSAEAILWEELRGRRIGFKFRRQVPIESFIVDFCCHEVNVVVELDGDSHNEKRVQDYQRDRRLNELGYCVLRYENCMVRNELNRVLEEIIAVSQRNRKPQGNNPSPLAPLPQGERGTRI